MATAGTSTDWNSLHTYEAPGTYTVRHNLNSPVWGIRDVVKTDLITVHAPLKAGFTAAPRAGYGTLEVRFTDTTTGDPASWHWEFGDGSTSTAQHPSHFYSAPGSYTVVLTVANTAAGTKTATKTGYITVLPLTGGKVQIEAEDYDEGGEGVAYHDTTAGNSGHVYRENDVDIVGILRGGAVWGYAVTNTAETEWTRYTVLSPGTVAADYPLTLRGRVLDGLPVDRDQRERDRRRDRLPAEHELRHDVCEREHHGPARGRLEHGAALLPRDRDERRLLQHRPGRSPAGDARRPAGTALPTDTNGDGQYDDVNGNGRADFADVVLYFNQMSWIAANEPISAFDYNGNGRIDFADVVWLFNHL